MWTLTAFLASAVAVFSVTAWVIVRIHGAQCEARKAAAYAAVAAALAAVAAAVAVPPAPSPEEEPRPCSS